MILLVSEVEEFKANPDKRAQGTVVEAELDKGRGPVATLLVQNGTMNVGDPIVVGNTFGRIRAMVNDLGRRVKTAGPSTPVEITGLSDVPQAGDQFLVFEDEKKKLAKSVKAVKQEQKKLNVNSLLKLALMICLIRSKKGNLKKSTSSLKPTFKVLLKQLKAH